jgi:hypothetical protein
VEKLLRKNLLINKNEAVIKNLTEIARIKSKNPIRYKINEKGQQLFGIIKSNMSTFMVKMLKSLKMMLVRPSFEAQFNSQFAKIVNKLAKDANQASNAVIEKIQEDPQDTTITLSTNQISRLQLELEEFWGKKEKIKAETEMKLPEHVLILQEEVGGFTIPANNEIVHEKFNNLITKKCMELEDGSIYEGQWSKEGLRTGRGKCLFKDGVYFDGFWIDGVPEIIGRFIKPNKDLYEGIVKKGKFNGKGIMFNPNGYKYVGEWKDNMKHGKGEEIFEEKGVYRGEFKNNFHHGEGKKEVFRNHIRAFDFEERRKIQWNLP